MAKRKAPPRPLRRSSIAFEQGYRQGYRHGFDDALPLGWQQANRQHELSAKLRNQPAGRVKVGRPPKINDWWRSVIRHFDSDSKPSYANRVGRPVDKVSDAEVFKDLILEGLVAERGMLREKAETLYESDADEEGEKLRGFNKTLQNALGEHRRLKRGG